MDMTGLKLNNILHGKVVRVVASHKVGESKFRFCEKQTRQAIGRVRMHGAPHRNNWFSLHLSLMLYITILQLLF